MHVANAAAGAERIVARMEGAKANARLSAITAYELRVKLLKRQVRAASLAKLDALFRLLTIEPFGEAAAEEAAQLRARLEPMGAPIGPMDTLQAGHALALGAVWVTDNVREFARVPGLRVQNWRT